MSDNQGNQETAIDKRLRSLRESREASEREEQMIVAARAAFPDVVYLENGCDVFSSRLAHAAATHVDYRRAIAYFNMGSPLYATVQTPVGEARVYSSRRVDVAAGFTAWEEAGSVGNPIEYLRATADAAEAQHDAASKAEKVRRQKQAEHDEAERREKEIEKAQPVRVIGEVAVRPVAVRPVYGARMALVQGT